MRFKDIGGSDNSRHRSPASHQSQAVIGHFRKELLDQVEQMIEERVEQLRADVNKADEGEVVLLPNPLRKRSGHG